MSAPDPIWLRSQTIATVPRIVSAAVAFVLIILCMHLAYAVLLLGEILFFTISPVLSCLFLFVFGSFACTVYYLFADALDTTTPFRVSDYALFRALIIREAISIRHP